MKRILKFISPERLVAIAAVVGIFLFIVLGDNGIYQFRRLMEMRNGLSAERDRLNEDIDRLTRERAMLTHPENLEPIIRSELGYIRPGEILFEERTTSER